MSRDQQTTDYRGKADGKDWHERIMQAGESLGLSIKKPARFGSGTHMTVAVLKEDWCKPDGEGV